MAAWKLGLISAPVAAALMIAPVTASAAEATSTTPPKHRAARHKAGKPKRAMATGPIYKDEHVALPHAVPACSRESAAALNERYNLHAFAIPVPKFQDSLINDMGCVRTNLAKYGFGFFAYSVDFINTNTLNHYVPPSNLQVYGGQRTLGEAAQNAFLTYDLSQHGVPDGQLSIGGVKTSSTYNSFYPNALKLARLTYYQTLANKKLEFTVGYFDAGKEFQGTQIGGNLANPLGVGGTIGSEVGQGTLPSTNAGFMLKGYLPSNPAFYDKVAVVRSTLTTAAGGPGSYLAEQIGNPTGFDLYEHPTVFGVQFPKTRPLVIDEVGYETPATSKTAFTWIRLTGYYNTSEYASLQTPGAQVKNNAVTLYADQQILRTEPGSDATAYKGVYVGFNAGYTNPQASAITQDYAARIYTFGLFGRPKDQISFLYEHQVVSRYLADATDLTARCLSGTSCVRHASNTFTVQYTANIYPGLYTTLAAQYSDHPSTVYSPNASVYGSAAAPVLPQYNIKDSLSLIATVFANF